MTTLDNILGLTDTPAGDTYHHERDGHRLSTLQQRVADATG